MPQARKTNRSKKQEKKKAKPEGRVGIFWWFDGKLIVHSTPLSEAESYGDSLTEATGHVDYWSALQERGAVPREVEYEEPPRGRVRYDRKAQEFVIYADRCILRERGVVQQILTALHLPKTTKCETDYHYRCSRCLYGSDDERGE